MSLCMWACPDVAKASVVALPIVEKGTGAIDELAKEWPKAASPDARWYEHSVRREEYVV